MEESKLLEKTFLFLHLKNIIKQFLRSKHQILLLIWIITHWPHLYFLRIKTFFWMEQESNRKNLRDSIWHSTNQVRECSLLFFFFVFLLSSQLVTWIWYNVVVFSAGFISHSSNNKSGNSDKDLNGWLRELPKGIVAIGRLDKETTGLLLLTNDGDLNHGIRKKDNSVIKQYHLTLDLVSIFRN